MSLHSVVFPSIARATRFTSAATATITPWVPTSFRARSTQQGYSPFSTWTRGLAWAILGYAEELEFFATIPEEQFSASTGLKKSDVIAAFEQAAKDTADHYIDDCSTTDGITYWARQAPDRRHSDAGHDLVDVELDALPALVDGHASAERVQVEGG